MLAAMFSTREINSGGRQGTFAQSDYSGNTSGLRGMTHINKLRCRSKRSQIPAGVDDSGHNSSIFQSLDGAIDRKTFGDPAKGFAVDRAIEALKDTGVVAGID